MSSDMLPQIAIDFLKARERFYEEPLPERARIGLAMSLRTLAHVSGNLSAAFEADPTNVDNFNEINRELAIALTVASQNLDAFRAVQDCAGEA